MKISHLKLVFSALFEDYNIFVYICIIILTLKHDETLFDNNYIIFFCLIP